MLGSHYEKKPLDLSKFYNPLPEAFPRIISCGVQHVEQQVLEVWRRKIWMHWYYLRPEHQAGERPWSTDFQCSMAPNPEHFTHAGGLLPGSALEQLPAYIHRTPQELLPAACSGALTRNLPRPMHLDGTQGNPVSLYESGR